MCKCCGEKPKEKEVKVYECKKCGKSSKELKYCCGEQVKEKK